MFFISLIIRVPPSRGVHCRLDVLENDKKPNFQENIPGKVRFKKKWGAMATRPPIPPPSFKKNSYSENVWKPPIKTSLVDSSLKHHGPPWEFSKKLFRATFL